MVLLSFAPLLSTGNAGISELEVVVEKINDAIKEIADAEDEFVPETFAFGASVASGSFGGADSASLLSTHYNVAHEVIWKTLRGVKADLVEFRHACKAAMEEIKAADDHAADNIRVITNALGTVASGGQGQASDRAHDEARQHLGADASEGSL